MNNCDQNTNSLLPLLAGFSEQRIMQNSFFSWIVPTEWKGHLKIGLFHSLRLCLSYLFSPGNFNGARNLKKCISIYNINYYASESFEECSQTLDCFFSITSNLFPPDE